MVKIGYRSIVEKIQNTDSGEGFRNYMSENRRGRLCVHGWLTGKYVVELCERIDKDEYICGFKGCGVPEYHPGYLGQH